MKGLEPVFTPFARGVLLAAMVLVGTLLFYECWRRAQRPGSLAPGQFRRRVLGAVLLEFDLLLWLLADLILPRLSTAGQLLYLGGSLLVVFAPIYLAIREVGFIARDYARSRRELVRGMAHPPERRENGGPRG